MLYRECDRCDTRVNVTEKGDPDGWSYRGSGDCHELCERCCKDWDRVMAKAEADFMANNPDRLKEAGPMHDHDFGQIAVSRP